MRNLSIKIPSLKSGVLTVLPVFVFFFTAYSQHYTKETIKLWEDGNIPFNKKNITLPEKTDSTGRRITQISTPEVYVYHNQQTTSNGPALLYCPGGGYANVSLKDEGAGYAKRLLEMDFNVVAILKYRLPDPRLVNSPENVPLCDAQKALALLHQHAKAWQIDEDKIVVMGGSAGGHLAASLANLKDNIVAPGVKSADLKQALSVLMYPVISFNLPYRHNGSYKRLLGPESDNQELLDYFSMENQVSENTPPTFLVHATDDQSVTYKNSLIYIESLESHGVSHHYVELEKGGHGFGFNLSRVDSDWTEDLEKWLRDELNK